ncbi:hypothetical protein JAAARDRAFT_56825 [Jaapia argillacea MUCL 33604]|uniref:Uncharacterized protein n=1 Tax=Jaapia argillacea MUCL 33604 TaxID=933084 RepID=A0A067PYJ3_9AGAM|nr:hypothetical protein JAAARDRAFT_56825 [Jaapia argillacea MUCL 33604]
MDSAPFHTHCFLPPTHVSESGSLASPPRGSDPSARASCAWPHLAAEFCDSSHIFSIPPIAPHNLQPSNFPQHKHTYLDLSCIIPSPPLTGSDLKRTVPLPLAHDLQTTSQFTSGNILDVPVMQGDESPFYLPPTPPATFPLTSQALPSHQDELQFPPGPSNEVRERRSIEGDASSWPHPDLSPHLLTPLSPDWNFHGMSDYQYPREHSALMSQPPFTVLNQPSGNWNLPPPSICGTWFGNHSPSVLQMLPSPPVSLPSPQDDGRTERLLESISNWSDGDSAIHLPPSPRPRTFGELPDEDSELSSFLDFGQPSLSTMNPSESYDDHWVDDMDLDISSPSSPHHGSVGLPLFPGDLLPNQDPPESPAMRSFASLPDLDDTDSEYFSTPLTSASASPSRRSCTSLPDSDSDEAPVSPRQTILSLPGAETDDDLLPLDLDIPPALGLLIVSDHICTPSSPEEREPEIEPDIYVPPFLSSDPETSQLCDLRKRFIASERAARRAEVEFAERASNVAAALLATTYEIDATTWDDRVAWRKELKQAKDRQAAARRLRKKQKERSREVGALLTLKVAEKSAALREEAGLTEGKEGVQVDEQLPSGESEQPVVVTEAADSSYAQGIRNNVSQLVAKMVLKRRESFRPLTSRTRMSSYRRKSSLSQSSPVEDHLHSDEF